MFEKKEVVGVLIVSKLIVNLVILFFWETKELFISVLIKCLFKSLCDNLKLVDLILIEGNLFGNSVIYISMT
jgi:hypothetical protein